MKISNILLIAIFFISIIGCEEKVFVDPSLIVSEDTLYFNENESHFLYLSTNPATECNFQVTSYPDWITVSPKDGVINGDIREVIVSSNFQDETPGFYEGEINLISTCGNNSVFVKGFVGEYTMYNLYDTIQISMYSTSESFIINNTGNVDINFEASASDEYVSVVNDGIIGVGQSKSISVSIDRDNLANGMNEAKIFLKLNEILDTVCLKIDHFKEYKTYLESDVMDAEYAKTTDELIFVSSSLKLYKYNTVNNTIDEVSLGFIPTCISVSKNADVAVVGHDGHISVVDLINKKVIKTINVSCYVYDVALGYNNWAYAVPKDGTHVKVHCVNLEDGTEVEHQNYYSISDESKIKLHPGGKSIYLADNGVSPSDMDKLSIENDTAYYLYDCAYHGDYPINGDLWFSEDGDRIFTRGGSVFKTSEIEEYDMLYNGKINLSEEEYSYNRIQSLDHSQASNNLYLIATGTYYDEHNLSYAYIYNASNLVYKDRIELEKYLVSDGYGGGNFYDAEPYYIFSNSLGNKVYVLTKAYESGLVNEWAIQTLNIDL